MKKNLKLTYQNNKLILNGHLDYLNVMTVYQDSLKYLTQQTKLEIDFAGVKSSDSVGLALMLEWLKFGKNNQTRVNFINIPENLISLAKLTRLDQVINYC